MKRRPPEPRPQVAALDPYVPGRPSPSEDGSLASNESPFGPSPAIQGALAGVASRLHRYPDPLAGELRRALGRNFGVDPEAILVANGSDELIYLLTIAYAAGGGSVVCADPPYRLNDIVPSMMGATVTRVPLRDWSHDLEAMTAVAADIAFVCNPHNPTGTAVSREALWRFVDRCRARLVVVDEAYIDFVDDPAGTTLLGDAAGEATAKLVVLRTFSKVFGLAGARVGYLVGSPEIVTALRTIRPPFSVGTLAQAAALAGLEDPAHTHWVREQVRSGREQLRTLFEAAGYEVVPSQANFVLVLARDADALAAHLVRNGGSVRLGTALDVPGAVRVSVPSARGFELLQDALGQANTQPHWANGE
jgi:histidinol-phosphate aminotransferase